MSGFGFSIGDFITAIRVVNEVIHSLREVDGAGAQYRELINELRTLENALLRVKNLDEDVDRSERLALKQAAAQCQQTIDDFLQKIAKYQSHLRTGGSGSRIKDGWMKIRWTQCKKEDVDQFRASLRGHTGAINLELNTVLMNAVAIQGQQQKSIASRIQDSFNQIIHALGVVSNAATSGVEQGKQFLEMTASIMRTNVQVFQILCAIQKHINTSVPGQVGFGRPVCLVDALGKPAPFQLEFIRSSNALLSVLKANFSHIELATEKIERGEFILQDTATQRIIDISRDWDRCFRSGQKVTMSMIFRSNKYQSAMCPSCLTIHEESVKGDIQCSECGLVYQDVYTMSEAGLPHPTYLPLLSLFLNPYSEMVKEQRLWPIGPKGLPWTDTSDLDEMRQYSRVSIIAPRPLECRPETEEVQSSIDEFMNTDFTKPAFNSRVLRDLINADPSTLPDHPWARGNQTVHSMLVGLL